MDARLLRQAAVHGPEFVSQLLQLEAVLHSVAATLAKAATQGQEGYALAPPPEDTPHHVTRPSQPPYALPPP